MYQNNPPVPVNTLPTMYDLPSEDLDDINLVDPPSIDHLPTMYDLPSEDPEEMGLPDKFHDLQPMLLRETCLPSVENFFIGIDMNLYYDVKQTGWYKRPDWFLVLGTSDSKLQSELRLSYITWLEGLPPFLMVELLSPGTEAEDLGSAARVSPEVTSGACPARQTLRMVGKPPTKWQVYEQILRIPYYAIFDRYSNMFRMFCLQGTKFVEQIISGQGFWFDDLQLGLGVWTGVYESIEGQWLRWYDATGKWVSTRQEGEFQAQQEAKEAKQEAEAANQRAALLAAKLRELGIDADGIL